MSKRARRKGKPKAKPAARRAGLVTRDELAAVMGVNAYTITKWQRDGLPVAKRGRAGVPSRYDHAACLAWKVARDAAAAKAGGLSVAEENAKLKRAQTEAQELRNRKLRTELIPAVDVERTWAAHVAEVRAKLLAIPRASAERASQAALDGGPAAVEAVLRDDIHAALRELAGAPDQAPAPAAEQPAEALA